MAVVINSETLRALRLKAAHTQESLAEAAGISRRALQGLEHGLHGARQSTVHKLAAALQVPVSKLTRGA